MSARAKSMSSRWSSRTGGWRSWRCPSSLSPARPGRRTTSSSSTTTPTTPCGISLPHNPFRVHTSAPAATSAAQAASHSASCTPCHWARTGCGWPTTTAGRRTPTCWPPCSFVREGIRWPRCRQWCATWPTPAGWRSRCAAAWRGAGTCRSCGSTATATCWRASPRCSTARCSGRRRWKPLACLTFGCSSVVTRSTCTGDCCSRGCRSAPAWTRCTCTRRGPTSSSRSSAAGCTPSTPTTPRSATSSTATAAICSRNADCASWPPRSGCASGGSS